MFNDLLWTAIKIPAVIDPVSEYGIMYDRFKQHTVLTNSDGVKFALFVTSVDNPADAIKPVVTEDNTLEDIYTEIKAHLTGLTQSAVMSQGLASEWYKMFIEDS